MWLPAEDIEWVVEHKPELIYFDFSIEEVFLHHFNKSFPIILIY
jgi:hypothetical protein